MVFDEDDAGNDEGGGRVKGGLDRCKPIRRRQSSHWCRESRVIIALHGSQLALVRGLSAVRVDSIVDDSWIVSCGSKC